MPSALSLLLPPTRLYYVCVFAYSLQAGGEEAAADGDGSREAALPLPPPRALSVPVRGEAGAWLLTESRAKEKLADVLVERAVELDALGLDEFAFLPFENQKQVQQRFRQRWLESEDGRHFARMAQQKTSSTDAYNRTLESYYRKSQYEDYGDRLWQYCLAGLGCLPPRLIAIVQDVTEERTQANRAAAASSTAPASTRGQLPRAQRAHLEGQGVRHRRCNVYELRARCKAIDRQIQRQKHLWRSSSQS